MADQERVLRLLNSAIDTAFGTNCELVKLPVTVAIEIEDLLAERERSKPSEFHHGNRIDYFCRNCTTEVGMLFLNEDTWRFHCRFCPSCGREVNWNG